VVPDGWRKSDNVTSLIPGREGNAGRAASGLGVMGVAAKPENHPRSRWCGSLPSIPRPCGREYRDCAESHVMKVAFSTIACPDWTLEHVMSFADEVEFDGVELRSFGWSGSDLACDPALTDAAKVRRLAIESGTHVMCLGTSLKFDDPIWPPVVGHALPGHDRCVQAARRFIELADDLECPCVRVFGFQSQGGEKHAKTVGRVVNRLGAVLDVAGTRRVRIVLENGGSFDTAEHLAEVIRECGSPWIQASYNMAVGAEAGGDVEEAIDLLGDRLMSVRLNDMQGKTPVEIGQGEVPIARGVQHLARVGFDGWLVVDWMRFWQPGIAEGDGVLRRSMETIQSMIAQVNPDRCDAVVV
jgi:sugar phosphate isomerase/epimerase